MFYLKQLFRLGDTKFYGASNLFVLLIIAEDNIYRLFPIS